MAGQPDIDEAAFELRQSCRRLNELVVEPHIAEDDIEGVILRVRDAISNLRRLGMEESNVRVAFGAAIMAELV